MTDAGETPFPPASHMFGEPTNWVIGVIDDRAEAERAAQAARDAGFPEQDVVLLSGQEALDLAQAKEDAKNPLAKLYSSVMRKVNEPAIFEQNYLKEVKWGHTLLNLCAEQPEQVGLATQILQAHNGHRIKHFGSWAVTDVG